MQITNTFIKKLALLLLMYIGSSLFPKISVAQGFSKPFNYRGDTQMRSDMLGSYLIYQPQIGKLFFPNCTMNQGHGIELWRKTDENGNVIASSLEEVNTAGGYQNLCGSFVWNDSNQFLSAGTYYNLGDTFQTFFLQQRDTNLQVIWRKEYPTDMDRVYPRAYFPISSSSNLLVVNIGREGVFTNHPPVTRNIVFIKTDHEGNELWRKRIDSMYYTRSFSAIYTPEHHILICGQTTGYGANDSGAGIIMKLDTLGNTIWQQLYNKPGFDALEKISLTADGNYVAVGWANVPPTIQDMPNGAGRILKIDTAGNVIWDKVLDISARAESFRALTLANNGDIVAVGSTYKYYAYDIYNYMLGSNREPDAWVVRMDLQGNEVWNRVFGHNAVPHAHEYLYSAVSLAEGGFVMAGSTEINDTALVNGQYISYNRPSGWLVRIDENGCVDSLCSETTTVREISTKNKNNISLYPNPGNGQFTLSASIPLAKGTLINITNLMGQKVYSQILTQPATDIPIQLSHKASGIYLVSVQNETFKESIKYIID